KAAIDLVRQAAYDHGLTAQQFDATLAKMAALAGPGSALAAATKVMCVTSCDDGNPCTTDSCNPGTGCVHLNNTLGCNDGNACTPTDGCHTAGTSDPSSATCTSPHAPNNTGCNDGNACTRTDTCQSGSCVGTNPVVCTASDQCHAAGICIPASGICTNPPAP